MLGSDTMTGGAVPANTDEEQSDKNPAVAILNLETVFILKPRDAAECFYRVDKHQQKTQHPADVTESTRFGPILPALYVPEPLSCCF